MPAAADVHPSFAVDTINLHSWKDSAVIRHDGPRRTARSCRRRLDRHARAGAA